MIKKTILVTTIFATTIFANTITFENAPKNPKHKLPNAHNEILSFHSILKDSMNSVVNISNRTINYKGNLNRQFFEGYFGNNMPPNKSENSLGSGVIISKDGFIITNNHVIDGADEISVTINGRDKEYIAKIIGRDKGTDLAVIKIEVEEDLLPIIFSHIEDVKLGDVVFAIGNPFGVGQTITQGIISALNKFGVGINQYENFIQTDASINPGNSGGALIDSRGALIGINSAILSKTGGNHGIGFTIPVDMVKNVVTKLVLDGKVIRGFLGVGTTKVSKQHNQIYTITKGAIVTNVQEDSPAHKAQLKRGDLLYAVNGKPLSNPHELQQLITSYRPHEEVIISLERDGKKIEQKVKLASINGDRLNISNIDKNFNGLHINNINDKNRGEFQIPEHIVGVVVEDVEVNSQAYIAGFSSGDIIIQIEDLDIRTVADASKGFEKFKGKSKRIYINRRDTILLVVTQ
ncbi:MAG: trypsin-like peptidase domain-containing protein [Sulfurovaceae bacterium]|nr:trypsin-like peptidase domain-containing protein [Sulfurovaceae bacterium]